MQRDVRQFEADINRRVHEYDLRIKAQKVMEEDLTIKNIIK